MEKMIVINWKKQRKLDINGKAYRTIGWGTQCYKDVTFFLLVIYRCGLILFINFIWGYCLDIQWGDTRVHVNEKRRKHLISFQWGGMGEKHALSVFIDSKTFKAIKLYILEWREYDN